MTTTLGDDGKPYTTFNGSWTWVNATGRYAGHSGSGTYQGHLPSPDSVFVEWEGQMQQGGTAAKTVEFGIFQEAGSTTQASH